MIKSYLDSCIASGKVYTFGCCENGRLGYNTTKDQLTPRLVSDIVETVVELKAGGCHTAALDGLLRRHLIRDFLLIASFMCISRWVHVFQHESRKSMCEGLNHLVKRYHFLFRRQLSCLAQRLRHKMVFIIADGAISLVDHFLLQIKANSTYGVGTSICSLEWPIRASWNVAPMSWILTLTLARTRILMVCVSAWSLFFMCANDCMALLKMTWYHM